MQSIPPRISRQFKPGNRTSTFNRNQHQKTDTTVLGRPNQKFESLRPRPASTNAPTEKKNATITCMSCTTPSVNKDTPQHTWIFFFLILKTHQSRDQAPNHMEEESTRDPLTYTSAKLPNSNQKPKVETHQNRWQGWANF
jgi:hypothetical protein